MASDLIVILFFLFKIFTDFLEKGGKGIDFVVPLIYIFHWLLLLCVLTGD